MSRGLRPPSSAADDRQPPRRYRDLECVTLLDDLPERGLRRGEVGTIVHVFDVADAYLVEFIDDDGGTRAEVELTPRQMAPA